MRPQRIALLSFSILGLLSVFFPWDIMRSNHFNILEGDNAIIVFLLFLFCIILSITGKYDSRIRGKKLTYIIIISLFAGLIGVFKIIDIHATYGDFHAFLGFIGSPAVGFGIYMLIIAALGVPIVGFTMTKSKVKNRKKVRITEI